MATRKIAASQKDRLRYVIPSARIFESMGRENRFRNFWLFDEVYLIWLWLLVIGIRAFTGLSFYDYRFIIWPVLILLALAAYLIHKLPQKGQIIVITDERLSVEGDQQRRFLRWDEVTEGFYHTDEGKRWLFFDANKKPFILKLEGFSLKDCEAMKDLIIVKLKLQKAFRE